MKSASINPFLALLLLESSNAATVIDVSSPWGGTKGFLNSFGQTFTPTLNGTLNTLRINLAYGASFSVTIWDFDPTLGKLGNILGSQNYATNKLITGYGWVDVIFSNSILQTAGQPMAFTISASGAFGPAMSNTSPYSGGSYFEYSGNNTLNLTVRDLNFQTLVTTIPEPGIGFVVAPAIAGVGLARKRKA